MYTFHVKDDIVIVGSDPEMADIVNPRGNLYGHAAFVVAERADGYRSRLHVLTDQHAPTAREPAQQLCDALNARMKNLGKLPIGFSGWHETFPAYMSAAYSEHDTIEWERELDRQEEFA